MTRSTWWGRIVAGAAAVVVVAIGARLVAQSGPGAHLGPVFPSDGAVLREAPREVSLTFDTAVRPQQIHIGVSDGRGELVPSGAAAVAGTDITQPVTIAGDGAYVLAYHVVLADGRSFSGVSRFQVSPAGSLAAPAPVTGHNHFSDDPLSVALTAVAAVFVVALIALLVHRPRPARSTAQE